MSRFIPNYRPVHKGASIVGKEAYKNYREFSKIRDPKKFNYYTDYRRITRKIWRKIAEYSIIYESGVYAKDFFYLVPQVVANKPFVETRDGGIKTNDHTNGNIYSPIFCNNFKNFNHFCWSLDGCFAESYKKKLNSIVNKYVPNYYFLLTTLLKNKF